MKLPAAIAALVSVVSVAAISQRQYLDVWAFTNFKAYATASNHSSTIEFDLNSTSPNQAFHCYNTTSSPKSIADVTTAYCPEYENFRFNFTTQPSGDKLFVMEWRYTSHGGLAGNHTISAAQIGASQTSIGPLSFNITDDYNIHHNEG